MPCEPTLVPVGLFCNEQHGVPQMVGYALLWVAALLARTASQPLALLRSPRWRKDHRKTDR